MNPIIEKVIAQIFSGIAYGSIYGLFALAIVFLYRVNRLFNLASTEIATFFVICMFFLLKHFSYAPAFIITVVMAFVGGCGLHFGLMRVVTERKNVLHSNETVITIGLFTILNSLSSYLFSDEPEKFPSAFPEKLISVFGVNVPSNTFVTLGFALLVALIIFVFLRATRIGLLMEATAENIVNARLRGIRVSNILALAWGLGTVIAVSSGIIIAPVLFVSPGMLRQVFSYALIAVAIGGLESPFGAIVGGILVGVVENLSTNISFIGSELKFVAVFALLVMMLIVKPRGLWGREEQRRV
jgi:branched-chain amino acid transport system permease protein